MSGASALSISCGWGHTVLVPGSGLSVVGWGLGPDGQLSTKKGFTEFGAQQLDIPEAWFGNGQGRTQADVGNKHTALICDGNLYTLGSNEHGRLGHEKGRYGKVSFEGKDKKVQIVGCGAEFTIAVVGEESRKLYGWGINAFGNLGLGKVSQVEGIPQLFHILDKTTKMPKRINKISCGSEHVLALCMDGQVYSWGRGTYGRLGHGNSKQHTCPRLIEDLVVSQEECVIQVAAGDAHSMALNKEGRVYTWGMGSYGRLGLGTLQNVHSPRLVVKGLGNNKVKHISCHTFHSLVVVQNSGTGITLYTWGGGQFGKLGLRDTRNKVIPTPVRWFSRKLPNDPVIIASCGLEHTAAITKSGRIFAWGYVLNRRCGFDNVVNTLDNGSSNQESYISEPKEIVGLDSSQIVGFQVGEQKVADSTESGVQQLACGVKHSVARLGNEEGGYLMAWGSNEYGQMGTGPHKSAFKPIKVVVSLDHEVIEDRITAYTSIVHVSCGDYHTIARSKTGNVFCWGRNDCGQLGLGDLRHRNKPELVELLQGEDIRTVEAGGNFSAAVPEQPQEDEERFPYLFLWGDGSKGQLGFGSEIKQLKSPKQLQLKITPVYSSEEEGEGTGLDVVLGRKHTLILVQHNEAKAHGEKPRIKSDVYVSGEGRNGKLGLGDFDDRWEFEKIDFQTITSDKAASGIHSSSSTPNDRRITTRIEHIFAGPTSSMAVFQHEKNSKLHIVYAWGALRGLFAYDINTPKQIEKLGKLLQSQSYLGTPDLRVVDAALAESHMLICVENGEKRFEVIACGEPRYGKLGIGNVASQLEDHDDAKGVEMRDRAAPPRTIPLSEYGISSVASKKDHSLAASKDKVFAWGHAGDGRLGLGELEMSRSETEPRSIRIFDRNADRELEERYNEGQEEEAGDDDDQVMEDVKHHHQNHLDDRKGDKNVSSSSSSAAAAVSGSSSRDPLFLMKQRLSSISTTIKSENYIKECVKKYGMCMREYSTAFEKYADQVKLIKLAIYHRMLQHHRVPQETKNKYMKSVDAITYQPLPDDNIAPQEEMEDQGMDDLDDFLSPYELNPLERHVARIHMAPSEFFRLYETEKKHWKEALKNGDYCIKEKKCFVKMVFSVYDVYEPAHFDRFLVFLKLVLQNHNDTTKADREFLSPHSVEWMIFCESLVGGKMRLRLKQALLPALSSVKYTSEMKKAGKQTPWLEICNPTSKLKTVRENLRHMKLLAERLVQTISKKYVERIMDYCRVVINVAYDVLERSHRTFMLGEYLIKAMVQNILDDLPFYHSKDDDNMVVERDALKYILLLLKHEKIKDGEVFDDSKESKMRSKRTLTVDNCFLLEAKNYLKDTLKDHKEINLDRFALELESHVETLSAFNSRRLIEYSNDTEDDLENKWRSPFSIFVDYIKTQRAKFAEENKHKVFTKINPKEEAQRRILTKFLKDRSTFSPRTLQLPLQGIHRFLLPRLNVPKRYWRNLLIYELNSISPMAEKKDNGHQPEASASLFVDRIFSDGGPSIWKDRYEEIPGGVCTNVRLDLFMADQNCRIIANRQCDNLWTPEYSSVIQKKVEEKKRQDFGQPTQPIIVSEEDCVKLYFTLKSEKYTKIIRNTRVRDVWNSILSEMSREREDALEESNNNLVQHLEWCRRRIRSIIHQDKKAVIKLGVPEARTFGGEKNAEDSVQGIQQASLDPATLIERLRAIDERVRMACDRLERNRDIIKSVIEHVEKEKEMVANNTKKLIEVFRVMSRRSEDEKSKQNLHEYFGIWKGPNDHSTIRRYKTVDVCLKRGNVLHKSYQEMMNEGLLSEIEILKTIQDAETKEWRKVWQKTGDDTYHCCMAMLPADVVKMNQFKRGLTFYFLTSERPDVVNLNITYSDKEPGFLEKAFARTEERNLIMSLELVLKTGSVLINQVGESSHGFSTNKSGSVRRSSAIYDPLGDGVPIRQKIKFQFPQKMYAFLKSPLIHRPNKVFDVEGMLAAGRLQDVLLDVL